MASFLKNWRIPGALLLAIVFIVGAYISAVGVARPSTVEASTESALLQAIATKDSDGDALPDWEEALYGTDPHTVDTKGLGMTDGEAVTQGLIVPKAPVAAAPTSNTASTLPVVDGVQAPAPGSLTDTFTKNFFSRYLATKQAKGGGVLSEEEIDTLVQGVVGDLTGSLAPVADFKSAKDLTVAGSGPDALRAFAISAEAVFVAHTNTAKKSELLYLKDALENSDASALEQIRSISKNYSETALGLTTLQVPQELAPDYLVLINTMERIAQITSDFANVDADPLTTMLALGQYPSVVLALGTSLIHIHDIYASAQVVLPNGTPGASLVNLIPDVAASQKTSTL